VDEVIFQDQTEAKAMDLASRIGDVVGVVLVICTFLLIIFPVVYSFVR
jgi:hypothetical protein